MPLANGITNECFFHAGPYSCVERQRQPVCASLAIYPELKILELKWHCWKLGLEHCSFAHLQHSFAVLQFYESVRPLYSTEPSIAVQEVDSHRTDKLVHLCSVGCHNSCSMPCSSIRGCRGPVFNPLAKKSSCRGQTHEQWPGVYSSGFTEFTGFCKSRISHHISGLHAFSHQFLYHLSE